MNLQQSTVVPEIWVETFQNPPKGPNYVRVMRKYQFECELPVAVSTPHTVLVMVTSLTVRPSLVSHVLPVQEDSAG